MEIYRCVFITGDYSRAYLDQPLETPDAFEESIASLPDLINLERDKLLESIVAYFQLLT